MSQLIMKGEELRSATSEFRFTFGTHFWLCVHFIHFVNNSRDSDSCQITRVQKSAIIVYNRKGCSLMQYIRSIIAAQ